MQVMQNVALRTATECTQDTNIQHLHDETLIHRTPTAPRVTIQTEITTSITPLTQTYDILQPSKAKSTIFNNGRYKTNISTNPHTILHNRLKNKRVPYTYIYWHISARGNNKILRTPPPPISRSEEILPSLTRRTLANSEQINHPS